MLDLIITAIGVEDWVSVLNFTNASDGVVKGPIEVVDHFAVGWILTAIICLLDVHQLLMVVALGLLFHFNLLF